MSISEMTPMTDLPSNGHAGTNSFVAKQIDGQWLARVFLGASVHNGEGQIVGDINDLVFDGNGRISAAVLGVGGFLGIGEKLVAIPFAALTIAAATDGERQITVDLGKSELLHAPTFEAMEKTTYDNVREIAVGIGGKASDAVVGLKDQAVRKIGEMNKETPKAL